MSRRLRPRLVTARAVDEVPEGLAAAESQIHDQPVTHMWSGWDSVRSRTQRAAISRRPWG